MSTETYRNKSATQKKEGDHPTLDLQIRRSRIRTPYRERRASRSHGCAHASAQAAGLYGGDVQPQRQGLVINIRDSIYSAIDFHSFFGVPKKEITDSTKVILVEAAGLEVGILADDVSGAASVPVSEIKPPLAAQSAAKEEDILGVTPKMLIIPNLEALLCDQRIIVHQEGG
jgi:hypothetical protein